MKLNMNMKNNLNKKIYRYKYNYKYMSIHLNSVCANRELNSNTLKLCQFY